MMQFGHCWISIGELVIGEVSYHLVQKSGISPLPKKMQYILSILWIVPQLKTIKEFQCFVANEYFNLQTAKIQKSN